MSPPTRLSNLKISAKPATYFQTGPDVQDMALYGDRNSAALTGRRRFSRALAFATEGVGAV